MDAVAWVTKEATGAQGENGSDTSSQSSMMSICSSDSTPSSQKTSSRKNKSTCLKRKKSLSRSGNRDFSWLEESSDERDVDITKRLNFDDLELNDECDESEKKTESSKKRRAILKETRKDTKPKRASLVSQTPIRNTCILESPLDHRKSSKKRRIYGIRRNEPQLVRKRPKRSPKRPMPFALCSLQRMFAE